MHYMGVNGFGCTTTCRRDRLSGGIPSNYWHKLGTKVDQMSRAASFLNPIVDVKKVDSDKEKGELGYERIHVSFQSTSSCNFSTVNALPSCNLSVRKKERGRGAQKRQWAIK